MAKKGSAVGTKSQQQQDTSASKSVSEVSDDFSKVVNSLVNNYVEKVNVRTKLIDSFMVFLVALGILQFVFCILVGTFVCSNDPSLKTWYTNSIL
jgi:oligosaccharyltransferase complex subunit epsilon